MAEMNGEERILWEAPRSGRLAQAYLISAGSAGTANAAASRFAKRILCKTHTGCGRCSSCLKFAGGNHMDAFLVKKEGVLKKEDVAGIAGFIAQKPFEGGYQCVVIPSAERMTAQAQNSLLKSLEEPPGGVVFVLSSAEPERLLATIRSRCMGVKLHAKSRAQIREALKGVLPDEMRAVVAAQARGSEEEALALAGSEAFVEVREAAFRVAQMLCEPKPSVFKMQEQMERDFLHVADALAGIFRDAIVLAFTGEEEMLFHPDRVLNVASLAAHFTSSGLSRMIEILLDAAQKKQNCTGLNERLLIETTLFALMEVGNQCLK